MIWMLGMTRERAVATAKTTIWIDATVASVILHGLAFGAYGSLSMFKRKELRQIGFSSSIIRLHTPNMVCKIDTKSRRSKAYKPTSTTNIIRSRHGSNARDDHRGRGKVRWSRNPGWPSPSSLLKQATGQSSNNSAQWQHQHEVANRRDHQTLRSLVHAVQRLFFWRNTSNRSACTQA